MSSDFDGRWFSAVAMGHRIRRDPPPTRLIDPARETFCADRTDRRSDMNAPMKRGVDGLWIEGRGGSALIQAGVQTGKCGFWSTAR